VIFTQLNLLTGMSLPLSDWTCMAVRDRMFLGMQHFAHLLCHRRLVAGGSLIQRRKGPLAVSWF